MDMDIFDLAKAKKLFGGGSGGKREGTAIPYGQPVSRIYFNTSNTVAETKAILSQLTFVQTPLMEGPIYAVYANTEDGNTGSFLIITKHSFNDGEAVYAISEIKDISSGVALSYFWSGEHGAINGWQFGVSTDTTTPISILFNATNVADWGVTLTDFSGLPIGAENEKIKNVLSITPF